MVFDPNWARVPHFLGSLPIVTGQNVQDVFLALRSPLAGGLTAKNFQRAAGIPNSQKAEKSGTFLIRCRCNPYVLAAGPYFDAGKHNPVAFVWIPDVLGPTQPNIIGWSLWTPGNPTYIHGTGAAAGALTSFDASLYDVGAAVTRDSVSGASWAGPPEPLVARSWAGSASPGSQWAAYLTLNTFSGGADSLPTDIYFDLWLKTPHVQ